MQTSHSISHPFSLNGKTILIIGADNPEGICTAQTCVRMGASVIKQASFSIPQSPVDGLLYCPSQPDNDPQNAATVIQTVQEAGLIRAGSGIVFKKNSSISASDGHPPNITGGLLTIAANLALRYAPLGVRINTITAHMHPNTQEQQDFAYAAVYLLSPASRWITASNLVVTGQATLS